MALRETVARLLGVSAYAPPSNDSPSLGDPSVDRAREALGGGLAPLPQTRLRWYLRELEAAIASADAGDLGPAGQLYRAMRRDGTFTGLLTTRSAGLVRLPRLFSGRPEIVAELERMNGTRSRFDELCPPSELGLLAADGATLGVGVAELVPVPFRSFPVLVRLEPEFLAFRWAESRWYYRSSVGLLPITPGDGRWVLHTPGGRMSPWQFGAWQACGDAWIAKTHAKLYRTNYGGKLANPARVVQAPSAATEAQRLGALAKFAAWGLNSVFDLPPGWEAKLLESNGRGHDVWKDDEESANHELMMALAGQIVTAEGGTGFANMDVHKAIRADLIQTDGDALAYTCNTQILPSYLATHWGEDAIDDGASVAWDTRQPKELASAASTLVQVATAIKSLREALEPTGRALDVGRLCVDFGVPLEGDANADGKIEEPSPELEEPEAEASELELEEPQLRLVGEESAA